MLKYKSKLVIDMFKNKKNILIILIIIAITIVITTFVCCILMGNNEMSNKINNKEINNNVSVAEEDNEVEEIQSNNDDLENKKENQSVNNVNAIDTIIEPVTYFENVNKSNDENVIKDGFIKIVDFIFYGEKINGYTFEELTREAKLKIINLALSLDKKVEEYFPGYKEKISNSTNKVYSNIKNFVVDLYISITSEICENNEELCNHAKEDFEFMKKAFNITFDYIGDLSNIGINKLEDWYEGFKNK